jgi:hypothetical protein
MSLVTRGRSPANSGKALPAPSGTGSGRSLSQTRLDRICRPTPVYWRSYLKWFNQVVGDTETYPSEAIKQFLQEELGPEQAALLREVSDPDPNLPAAQWEHLEDRLQRRWGQMRALTEVLAHRARGTRSHSRRAPGGSASTSATPLPAADSPDPFATE